MALSDPTLDPPHPGGDGTLVQADPHTVDELVSTEVDEDERGGGGAEDRASSCETTCDMGPGIEAFDTEGSRTLVPDGDTDLAPDRGLISTEDEGGGTGGRASSEETTCDLGSGTEAFDLDGSRTLLPDGDTDVTPVRIAGVGGERAGGEDFDTQIGSGGRFRILRFYKGGGLGDVFLAHDRELGRDVALKRIKGEYAGDAQRRSRFQVEAEITGGLEHPGIVPVYSLGLAHDGLPFYAMRFIQGDTLRDAAKRFHRAGPDARGAGLRGLLRRFLDVCDAVAYAHSRGVMHRDIKPSNIILGKFGETLLVDWGLAKAVGAPELPGSDVEGALVAGSGSRVDPTEIGARLGTPQYMAPEQAAGRLDEVGFASDTYGLGATLYFVLTGEAPVIGRNLQEVCGKVERGDFAPPRAVNPGVHPALDAVCNKAMALQPSDRYPTVSDLSGDLERWLADEPVSAYREPAPYRLARWGRRHRPIVAGAAGLLVTAVVALSIGAVLIHRERDRKEGQRRLAVANFSLARDFADEMLTEVGGVDLADIPQMEPVRRRLLEKARRGYQTFLDRRGDDPEVRLGAGRAYARLGDVQEMTGDYPEAERSYRGAVALLAGLLADRRDGAGARRELAGAYNGLGELLKKTNRFVEAGATFGNAIRLLESPAPGAADDQLLADARYNLAALLARLSNRQAESEADYRDALARQQALVAAHRDRPEFRMKLGRYLNNLAMLQAATGRDADAEASFREALDVLGRLIAGSHGLPGPRWQWARSANNLAGLLSKPRRRPSDAATWLRQAKDTLDTLNAEFPSIPQYRKELASVEYNLGLHARQGGHPSEAEPFFRRSAELLHGLAAEFPRVPEYRQKLAVALIDLNLLLAAADPSGAEAEVGRSLAVQEQLVRAYPDAPDYSRDLGRGHYELARLMVARREISGARHHLGEAIRLHRSALEANPENPSYRNGLYDDYGVLAFALLESGEPVEAAAIAEELPRLLPERREPYLNAAALLARCASLVSQDARHPEPVRRELEEAYGRRAVDLLREADQRRLIRPEDLDSPQFLPLRSREDFRKLGEEAGRKTGVGVG